MTFIALVVVRFPGELAKYDMLHEAIVHKCIKQVNVLNMKINYIKNM